MRSFVKLTLLLLTQAEIEVFLPFYKLLSSLIEDH